ACRTLQKEHQREKMADSRVAQLLDDLSPEILLYGMARTESEQVRLRYSHYIARIRGVKPLLNGWDIQKLGCSPGPLVGEILEGLRAARLDGKATTRADEVAWAQRYLREAARRDGTLETAELGTVER
ncbi:MAG: hypothetical protein WC913_08075, partial [Desulfuromonas sp.]